MSAPVPIFHFQTRLSQRWRTIMAGFLAAALSSPGQTFVLALYIEPLMAALSLSRLTVSTWYSVATLVAALGLIPSGYLADTLSPRLFFVLVLSSVAAGMVLLAGASAPWQVLLAFAVLRLAGQGAVGVGLLSMVVRRFPVARGRPLSIATLGYPAGEAVFPFLVVALMAITGWRGSLLVLAGMYLLLAIPAVAWLLTSGATASRAAERAPGAQALPPSDPASVSLAAALRTPVFWAALVAFSVSPIVVTALFFHQVAVFRLSGLGEGLVPLAFAVYALSHAAGTAAAGNFVDALSPRTSAVAGIACGATAVLAMFAGPGGIGTAVSYGILMGLATALSSLAGALVWPMLFGIAAVGRIRAFSSALRNGATAVGPMLILLRPGADLVDALLPLGAVMGVGLVASVYLPGAGGPTRRARSLHQTEAGSRIAS